MPSRARRAGDVHPDAGRRFPWCVPGIVRSIHETLPSYDVNDVLDPFNGRDEVQTVRTPAEVLERPRGGTCLDLSLLCCGHCLGCDLVPWLVILRGHAFVRVSLEHRLRNFDHLDGALALFDRFRGLGVLKKRPATAELLGWLAALYAQNGRGGGNPLRDATVETVRRSLNTLIKSKEDESAVVDELTVWAAERARARR